MGTQIIIETDAEISCPKCDHDFPLEKGITHQLLEQYESQLENQTKERAEHIARQLGKEAEKALEFRFESQVEELQEKLAEQQAASSKLKKQQDKDKAKAVEKAVQESLEQSQQLQEELEEKEEKLEQFRAAELELRKEKKSLEEARKELELNLQRKLDEALAESRKQSDHSFRLKEAEYQKKIADAQKANEDLKRKLEQGSQQLQGEVLELQLEEALQQAHTFDDIDPVKKGARGADVVQTVRMKSGSACGKIVWETKRAKQWSNGWITKLKDDQQAQGGELAVLVTNVFPSEMVEPFCEYEGVWVVQPGFALPLSHALRAVLMEAQRQKAISTGKDEKVEALYNYICSAQFAQKVRAVVEAYESMRQDLGKERAAMERIWKKREAQLGRITSNVMGMCGELQGISSSGMLHLEDLGLLGDSDDEKNIAEEA